MCMYVVVVGGGGVGGVGVGGVGIGGVDVGVIGGVGGVNERQYNTCPDHQPPMEELCVQNLV